MPDPYEVNKPSDAKPAEIGSPLDRPETATQSSEVKDGISTAPPQIKGEEGLWSPGKAETIAGVLSVEDKRPHSPRPPERSNTYLRVSKMVDRRGIKAGAKEWVQEVADEQSKLPEELYDSNPELFAVMKTAEFMKSLRRLRSLEQRILEIELEIEKLEAKKAECQEALDRGSLSFRNFNRVAGIGKDPRDQLEDLPLDEPPRKTLEKVRDDYDNRIEAKREGDLKNARDAKQAFLDKQKNRTE
ncbi:hypothetical protein HYX70_03280 [Candidatus Saccharibacteria bacterium]|nr:hypothetical protein [Candidatus Saccharibacteria bacterium]